MFQKIEKSYNQVRQELVKIGLLDDDVYLDQIELYTISKLTSFMSRAHGFVFDSGTGLFYKLIGFEEGSIYIATGKQTSLLDKSYTIADVIRHEYAHAWYWLDPKFVDGPWFKKAFGQTYEEGTTPVSEEDWLYYDNNLGQFKSDGYANDYVTPYAMTASYEDFAETFRFYIRNRKSLARFKSRTGVYKKLIAIKTAVERKANKLGLS